MENKPKNNSKNDRAIKSKLEKGKRNGKKMEIENGKKKEIENGKKKGKKMEKEKEKKNEKIVIITGKYAESLYYSIKWEKLFSEYSFILKIADINVASLMTPKQLEKILIEIDREFENVNWIFVTGFVGWDLSKIKHPLSNRLKKGPKFLEDFPILLKKHHPEEFSNIYSADKIFYLNKVNDYDNLIENLRENYLKTPNGFTLSQKFKDIIFSPDLPPVLFGEIIDAPLLEDEILFRKIERYIAQGVKIIDLGAIANEDNSAYFSRIIPIIKKKYNIPISIDSLNAKEIIVSVNSGADIILSISPDNYHALLPLLPHDIPIVLIPSLNSAFPRHLDPFPTETILNKYSIEIENLIGQKLRELLTLGQIFSDAGFTKIFLDPIFGPPISPGLLSSLEALILLKRSLDRIPFYDENGNLLTKPQLFMGFCNVIELIDADSPGINALLAQIAVELGVSGILTTEYSAKTNGAIKELNDSIRLAVYAKLKHHPPINLGIDVFRLKGKYHPVQKNLEKYNKYNHTLKIVNTDEQSKKNLNKIDVLEKDINKKSDLENILKNRISIKDNKNKNYYNKDMNDKYIQDPKGYFRILLDYYNYTIIVEYFNKYRINTQNKKVIINSFNDVSKIKKIKDPKETTQQLTNKLYTIERDDSYDNSLPDILFIGSDSEKLIKKIIEMDCISRLDHASYLGRELLKAEMALKWGASFQQS